MAAYRVNIKLLCSAFIDATAGRPEAAEAFLTCSLAQINRSACGFCALTVQRPTAESIRQR